MGGGEPLSAASIALPPQQKRGYAWRVLTGSLIGGRRAYDPGGRYAK
jgi:hypothetical protein